MQISLLVLFLIFCSLLIVQHIVLPKLINKSILSKKGVNSVVLMQIAISFYCVWMSASNDKATYQLGTGMLITSFLLFMWTQYKLK